MLTSKQKSYIVLQKLIHLIEVQHEVIKSQYDMLNRMLCAPEDFDYRPHMVKTTDHLQRVIDNMDVIIAGIKEAMECDE